MLKTNFCREIFIVVITKTGLYFHSLLVQTVSRYGNIVA